MEAPHFPQIDRVFLMGFMGSGKTTVGRLLAQRLAWTFVDLDTSVEERRGQTVPQIFAEFGEWYFREEESAALHTLAERRSVVIALGGGAAEHSASQTLLTGLSRSVIIYLQASFAELEARCSSQATQPGATARPLLADLPAARARFDARQPTYEKLATIHLDTSGRTPPEVVEAILRDLR